MEERVAYEKKVHDKVNARMFEVVASPIYKSDLEIEEDAIADQLKGIRINQIIIGLGVILIIIGAVFLILWLKRNRTKNRVKI